MALRLGQYLEWGLLYHSHRNSTHGYIKLRGMEQPIHLSLTGDPGPELQGKGLRFEPRPVPEEVPEDLPKSLRVIHPHQVGPTGDMTINRGVRTFPGYDMQAVLELARSPAGIPPSVWKRRLYLEWYSQNGRVLIELADPLIWVADYDKLQGSDEEDESVWQVPPEPESWAPPSDESPFEGLCDEGTEEGWYPGSDRRDESEMSEEEFIQELELLDDVITGEEPSQSLRSFVTESIPSGPVEQLSDEEAEQSVKIALAQLALRSIAVHVCEHYGPRETLHYLRTVIGDCGDYHPGLARSTFVQNYMTSEGCPTCEAEFDRKFEQMDAEIRRNMEEEKKGERDGGL